MRGSATATPLNMNGGPSCEATIAGTSRRLSVVRILVGVA